MAALAAAAVGGLLATGMFFQSNGAAYPAPVRVPSVMGLTKDRAVREIEKAKLRPRVRVERVRGDVPSRRHGRVVGAIMGNLFHVEGHLLPPISLEGSTVTIIVAA